MVPFKVNNLSSSGGRRRWRFVWSILVSVLCAAPALAQSTATVQGIVYAEATGAPLDGITILLGDTGVGTMTDNLGRFQLVGVPAGVHQIVAQRLGLEQRTLPIDLSPGETATISFTLRETALLVPEVIVSASRETQRLSETAATVGVIGADALRDAKPSHPSVVLGQIPGVWVSVTGGEGHMTAIRQPQSTKPLYLFLEDGVPTRSTGFFNHNALYEVNLPQAERVEVLKGPATALYGSDAIGGVINVETRGPSNRPSFEAFVEGGGNGHSRLLASASDTWGSNGLRADVNLTRSEGWRDATGYDRQSATVRWDAIVSPDIALRTVITGSRIDQQTAGSSALPREQYLSQPSINLTPISLREVRAFRASTVVEYSGERTLASVTPFVRWNDMELLPNWSLTYDPTIYNTGHGSAGLLARLRRDLPSLNTRLIAGVDVDYSPGWRSESRIAATRSGGVFTDYSIENDLYDYDVTFSGFSPYVQTNTSLTEFLHLTAGLRYDHMAYDYDTKLEPLATGRWRRPADADLSYDHLSPKLGIAYELGDALNLYANFNHGFRVPSEGQLFRQGSAANTLELEPVTADSYEGGLRGQAFGRLGYSLAAYNMVVENDILGYTLADGTPETQNAGRTLHRGVEAGLNVLLGYGVRADVSYSRAKHSYEQWSPRSDVDYAGKEMESAPDAVLNSRLSWAPEFLRDANFGVEWNRIGGYWLDPENTHRYDGHDLFNLTANVALPHHLSVVGRVMNIADTRYAETASYTAARGEELSPGMPRTVYLGIQYSWER